ncbi:MAG TPA: bile acid:sodium symporter [Candidatus Dormibacteraeota bacterium]|nr:bile acid:sodium symporter [Candidatus Dormibacteraeota bacterium]
MGGAARLAQGAPKLLLPVRHGLLAWVVVAALVGVGLPAGARSVIPWVPVLLAGQVLGVALTLTPGALRAASHHLRLVGLALLVQWTVLPGIGLLLHLLAPTPLLATGILICAVSPAEITSALMATVAGGDVALAMACMSGSLALSIALTPFWLSVGLGRTVHIRVASLALELALSVLLPLAVGIGLRARFAAIARWRHLCLDGSAACLVLVVLAGTASARGALLSAAILTLLPFVAALIVGGGIAGWSLGWLLRLPHRRAVAIGFPIGIREFGVAIAVAVAIAPRSSSVAGVYGILMVAAAGTLASRIGKRRRAPISSTDSADRIV